MIPKIISYQQSILEPRYISASMCLPQGKLNLFPATGSSWREGEIGWQFFSLPVLAVPVSPSAREYPALMCSDICYTIPCPDVLLTCHSKTQAFPPVFLPFLCFLVPQAFILYENDKADCNLPLAALGFQVWGFCSFHLQSQADLLMRNNEGESEFLFILATIKPQQFWHLGTA